MATNKIHSGKKCGPCSLCKQKKFHYTHISEWNDDQKQFLKTIEANISQSSCICKVCADDVKRNMHEDDYTPRWRKTKPKCKVIGCKKVNGIKLCNVTNNAKIEQLLELEKTTTGITLCTDHYNIVYRSLPEKVNLLAHQKCKTCNREISKKTDYHHCPDPQKIKEYLRDTVGCDVDINSADMVCLTCYKAHKTILEQENEQSKDKDLQELMVTLKTADLASVVEGALNEVTLTVAETLYKQEAIHLPTAYDMLTKLLRDQTVTGDKGISKQHLFSHLKQTLNKHLTCCTLQKSTGTLLYRKDGNLLLALTKVLQREKKGKLDGHNEQSNSNNEPSNSNQRDDLETANTLVAKVCTTMNTKLHQQAKKFINKSKTDEMDLTSLDMDQLIDSIDPALWSMIINLTKSCREAIRPDKHTLTQSRKLRCFYCLCVLLFITNNQCNTPLHVLLTDVLASHIGAQEKIKILNQLGAVASVDTHARYCQDIVQKKRQEGNTSLLSTFVTISVIHTICSSGTLNKETEVTDVSYLRVLNRNADDPETILEVLSWLHKELQVGSAAKYLLVAGDEKTYNHMIQLKSEYGEALDWLVTFPGDFHLMRIYQEVLMSAYWDAGLKQIAAASGYRGETLTSLSRCSNFTNTTTFLFEVWEALFHHTINIFHQYKNKNTETSTQPEDYDEYSDYVSFMTSKGSKDENWQFWGQFILRDCSVFLTLYLAVRTGNWDLRVASLKEMAALFFAFNRPHYQKLIVQHLSDLLVMPKEILEHLQSGKFVASLSGRPGHSVAIDEAHEMKINKDLKTAIVRPSTEIMNRLSLYLGHRTKMIDNLKRQLTKNQPTSKPNNTSLQTTKKPDLKSVDNIRSMLAKVQSGVLLPPTSTTKVLRNSFINKEGTPEQRHDLLNLRSKGQNDFETNVTYMFLVESSVRPRLKRKSVHTFSETKVTKKRLNNAKKEKKLISLCLKKRLKAKNYDTSGQCEQYIELPRAIADSNGMPHKGDKSNARRFLEKRYNMESAEMYAFGPDTVIYDGMFIIQTIPIPNTTMEDYVKLLINRFVKHHIDSGVNEVHIIFDHPKATLHPKCIEHELRDRHATLTQHVHHEFSDQMRVPNKWNELLQCWKCKRCLVVYIGNCILRNAKNVLTDNQKLFVAGHGEGELTDMAQYATAANSHNIEHNLTCSAEEANTRIWLHANQSSGKRVLVYSPDTDVLHIALLMVNPIAKDVCIQTNMLGQPRAYISITKLVNALERDPDLAGIPEEERPKILVNLYALSGCDYTSFFVGHGKVSIMKVFFEHVQFICEESTERPGSLAKLNGGTGFYSFLRLIGAVYFHAHRPGFPEHTSPESLYNSLQHSDRTAEEVHTEFIEIIRTAIWE